MERTSIIAIALTALLRAACATAAEPANSNLSPEAREVLAYLERSYGRRVLSGYNVYPHTPDDYRQTGRHAAVWGRDIRWLKDMHKVARDARSHGYILTLHWHWFLGGDSAWQKRRKKRVDVARVVTPGAPEHAQAMKELAKIADKLQVLQQERIPLLWRPLHEIDGGWFWWTDRRHPENTAKLWQMMFDYFTRERKLNNLIWVYSAGVGDLRKKPVEYRKRFYPGPQYVDIAGIDIYGVNVKADEKKYRMYFDVMSKVCPGKMIALSECDAIPNPDKMQRGETPKWLYAMPWWGCPSRRRSVDWARFTMAHDFIVTLDELPAFGWAKPAPDVGILNPRDDGSAQLPTRSFKVRGYAVDRDGKVARIELYAGKQRIAALEDPPREFLFACDSAPQGCYDLTVAAVDNDGQKTTSNRVRVMVGMKDLARGKRAFASAGQASARRAVDGDYYTCWSPGRKTDDEWLAVDLGAAYEISRVNLLWGWKIHASKYTIDVALSDPDQAGSWKTVYRGSSRRWIPWEATFRIAFEPVRARYVRLHALKRPRHQTWGAYQLAAFEVPVPVGSF